MAMLNFFLIMVFLIIFWPIFKLTAKNMAWRILWVLLFSVPTICIFVSFIMAVFGDGPFDRLFYDTRNWPLIILFVILLFYCTGSLFLAIIFMSIQKKTEKTEKAMETNNIFQLIVDIVEKEQPGSFTISESKVEFNTVNPGNQSISSVLYAEYGYENMSNDTLLQVTRVLMKRLSGTYSILPSDQVRFSPGFTFVKKGQSSSAAEKDTEPVLKKW